MTALLASLLPLTVVLGFVLGRRSPVRAAFNKGVREGLASACREHGWAPVPDSAVRRRRWLLLNGKPVAAPFVATAPESRPLGVLPDMPHH